MKKQLLTLAAALALLVLSVSAYSDVDSEAWFARAVQGVEARGLMGGYSDGMFHPERIFNRAQLAAVLYRMAGSPAVSGQDSFSDTQPGQWYSDAVTWAQRQGVVGGYADGEFKGGRDATQEQFAVMLWRDAGTPEADASANPAVEARCSGYAVSAVRWALAEGLISPQSGFSPKAPANRGQVADMLYRYVLIRDLRTDRSGYPIRDWSRLMREPTRAQIRAAGGEKRSPYIAIYPSFPGVDRAVEYCVDFHADHQPRGTYLSPLCWWMDLSPLKERYASVYTDLAGGYCGFQCWDDGTRVFIMTVWTTFCEDEAGNVTAFTPKVVYPEGQGNEFQNSAEGSFVNCLVPYDWRPGRDYRVLLQRGISQTTGNVELITMVCDLSTQVWTHLISIDTGVRDVCLGTCGAFVENYVTEYAGAVRTMNLSNFRARSADTGQWVYADSTGFLYNGSAMDLGYAGCANFGTDGSAIWAITSGVEGLCQIPSDQIQYPLSPGDPSDPY